MESSEAKAPSIVLPQMFTLEEMLKDLKNIPYKRLKFVTVKDNSQEKINKVGQCYDYLRRFSERIYLVKSPKGGIHFHALIVLKEGKKKVSFKKGIHIKVDDVGDPRPSYDPDHQQDKLIEAEELAQEALDLTGDIEHARDIYNQAMAPPSKAYQRTVRRLARTKKEKHISRIREYLIKNLKENEGKPRMYEHYIVKYLAPRPK